MRSSTISLCTIAVGLLSSCGSPGVPLPPSLELAKPVTDLQAIRKGNKVILTWTSPTLTTDRHNIQHPGLTEICRSIGSEMRECGTAVGKVGTANTPESKHPSKPRESFTDDLPATLQASNPTSSIFYAVSVLNSSGRSAGLSNKVQVPGAPALIPPGDFHAELAADGVRLSWKAISLPPQTAGVRFSYRVYRREQGNNKDAIAGEFPISGDSLPALVDRNFEWEKTYQYRATFVTFVNEPGSTEQQVEGDDPPPVTIVAHDIFPPAAPTGLQAVFSGPGQKSFIDLIWTPNTESD